MRGLTVLAIACVVAVSSAIAVDKAELQKRADDLIADVKDSARKFDQIKKQNAKEIEDASSKMNASTTADEYKLLDARRAELVKFQTAGQASIEQKMKDAIAALEALAAQAGPLSTQLFNEYYVLCRTMASYHAERGGNDWNNGKRDTWAIKEYFYKPLKIAPETEFYAVAQLTSELAYLEMQAQNFDAADALIKQFNKTITLSGQKNFEDKAKMMRIVKSMESQIGTLAADKKKTDDEIEKRMAAEELPIRQAEDKADDLPIIELKTSKGVIRCVLFENQAPNTVANFISLAEKKAYDGLKFHRVIEGFMAQGGCPKGDGTGDPGYRINDELTPGTYRKHFRGSLSMANSGPNTGGQQFFITLVPTPHLDGRHTVFGRVKDGMDIVDALRPDDIIQSVVVVRKRNHPYTPVTSPLPSRQTDFLD